LQHGIDDLSVVSPTGPKGTITKGDMLKYIKGGHTTTSPVIEKVAPVTPVATTPIHDTPPNSGTYKDIEISQIRSIIASRLTESKTTIPHQYTAISCKMSTVAALRSALKSQGTKVSVNDFIVKAVASALHKNPTINQTTSGLQDNIDISVAVATDSGLITPIVKNADRLGLSSISSTVRDLATRARERKLAPEEFMGGTFTISNLGMFGIAEFSAVINPPQACIMAVGGNQQKFLPDKDENDKYPLESFMTVQISSDARQVTQQAVIKFLEDFKANMENPVNMIV